MNHYLQILKDTLGQNYVGIHFEPEEIHPFLNQLKEHLGDSFDEYHNLQQTRDQGNYHMTFISVPEFGASSKNMGFDKFTSYLEHLMKVNFDDIKFLGLGTAEKAGNKAYFIVLNSNLLDETRTNFGLDKKDFHITIGFKWKDVHGVPKNQVMTKNNTFLKKLKSEYISEGDSFEFIKAIKNFDLDFFKLIEPIQINETNAIFRCGEHDYIQLSLVDDSITITGKWQDTNKLPILSQTLVERKLKQI
jgi:hypothetical protein